MKSVQTIAGAAAQVRDDPASAGGGAVPLGQRDAQVLAMKKIGAAGHFSRKCGRGFYTREIVRVAPMGQAKLLEAGVVWRVLQKDASVCGAANAKGFAELHDLVLLHMAMREKSLDSFGPAQTAATENYVVERLRTSFPDVPAGWLPA